MGNNIVWVTGAGHRNGLGYAIVSELERNDFRAVALDVSFDKEVGGISLDTTNKFMVDSLFNSCPVENLPSAIVNCAGVNITGQFTSYSLENLRKTFEVNVFGNFIFTQAFVNRMSNASGPKFVINIGSDSANTPRTNSFAYCSSKAAVQMFTRCLSRDLASGGYRFVELDPSLIEGTNMDNYINNEAAKIQGQTKDQIISHRIASVPIKRFASPDEIARWVPFILKNGEYANGSCIRITGGVI